MTLIKFSGISLHTKQKLVHHNIMDLNSILKSQNLAELCHLGKMAHGCRKAFTLVMPNGMNGSLSYTDVERLSDEFAVYLREVLKVSSGTRVAVQLPNSLIYPIVTFGIFKASCILVNTNPLYTVSEMIYQFNDSGAEVLITADLFGDKAAQVFGQTPLRHLIISRLPEFLPILPLLIAQGVLKYWHRRIPDTRTPHDSILEALSRGRRAIKEKNIKVGSYYSSLSRSDLAVLQYTGGTTGVPKAAELTHDNLLSNISQIVKFGEKDFDYQKETIITALPLYHIFAFSVNFCTFYAIGSHNILCPNPRPISNLQRAFENYKITWISGVNTLFNALNREAWFTESPPKLLKAAISGGMALQSAVAEEFRRITGVSVVEGYGLTEASPVTHFNPLDNAKPNSIGIPMPDTEVELINSEGIECRVNEPGEILVKGPQVMRGYWQRPDETVKVLINGWLSTGDIGYKDLDGYYYVVDRKKDMILVSGFNVYPNEVEDALTRHPHVLEAAVIGVPDGAIGEAVKAFIIAKDLNPNEEELRSHCRSLLTNYKVPKYFEFVTDLPKSPVGKILRKELRAKGNPK